jgi:hypothetical protein
MTWPMELSEDRYPGTIRRELSVDSRIEGDRVVFSGELHDRWFNEATGEHEEIHGWRVRLEAVPPDLSVVAAEATPTYLPFAVCPAAARSVNRLVGATMTSGFTAAARAAVGAVDGCTHLLTLLTVMAGQRVVANYLRSRTELVPPPEARARRERMVGACSGWREGGQAIELSRAGRPLPKSRIHGPEALEEEDES